MALQRGRRTPSHAHTHVVSINWHVERAERAERAGRVNHSTSLYHSLTTTSNNRQNPQTASLFITTLPPRHCSHVVSEPRNTAPGFHAFSPITTHHGPQLSEGPTQNRRNCDASRVYGFYTTAGRTRVQSRNEFPPQAHSESTPQVHPKGLQGGISGVLGGADSPC